MGNSLEQRCVIALAASRLLVAGLIAALVYRSSAAEVTKTVVYKAGQDGYHTYRIPAIIRAKNGDLLAFAEGRKDGAGDHGDIDIVLKRSSDDGQTWGAMLLVHDEWDDPTAKVWIGNPSPVVDLMDPEHPGRIWLAFTRSNERVFVTSSDDHGATWTARREITDTAMDPAWGGWYATGPIHGIQLERGKHAGRLIIPSDHRDLEQKGWGAHILYSDDHGATWQIGGVDTREAPNALHPNENVAVELVDGRILVNARDQHGTDPATRAVAYSSDGGTTFYAPFAAEPNINTPIVQNSLVRFAATDWGDERNILVYSCPGHATQRRDLTILASFDEGTSWKMKWVLHRGPAAYSDLVKLDEELLGVLYEAGEPLYGEIVFAVFRLGDFATGSK
ncbi:MAG: glycoside hydrolase [Planctomycetes bacterium]|nr:glycoside hydrolase [Planctomycetota bacterium]